MNIGEQDKIQATLRDSSTILRMHYMALLNVGFSRMEALMLTASLQAAVMVRQAGDRK